ncbi:MAG TPA: S8 family peptidase, partial [Longimicrobium sp.]|nr:S8 family peptidase [Longimicrobium sp.]
DRVDQRDRPLDGSYRYARTGSGVTVYVVDTGIQTSHPEFGGRASAGYDAFGGNAQDCNGHGTHVAGTVAGSTYGVAKDARVVAVRVLDCAGNGTTSTVVAGLDWVRLNRQGAAVANLSLGGGADQAIDDALRRVISSGVTAVVAAGNQPADNACSYSPARVGEALTVGASNANDQKAWFSKFGSCVDLFAPGEGITSAWIGGGTNTIDGTSMASPHVAGAAALYLQGSPGASAAAVHGFIVNDASTSRLSSIGTGSPNRLLFTLATDPFAVSISGPTYITVSGEYTWTAAHTGGGLNPQFTWEVSWDGLFWSPLGSGPSLTYWAGGMDFYLRLTGTRGTDGVQARAVTFVQAPCMETNPDYACY